MESSGGKLTLAGARGHVTHHSPPPPRSKKAFQYLVCYDEAFVTESRLRGWLYVNARCVGSTLKSLLLTCPLLQFRVPRSLDGPLSQFVFFTFLSWRVRRSFSWAYSCLFTRLSLVPCPTFLSVMFLLATSSVFRLGLFLAFIHAILNLLYLLYKENYVCRTHTIYVNKDLHKLLCCMWGSSLSKYFYCFKLPKTYK